jgi:hypothetical protein
MANVFSIDSVTPDDPSENPNYPSARAHIEYTLEGGQPTKADLCNLDFTSADTLLDSVRAYVNAQVLPNAAPVIPETVHRILGTVHEA